MKNKNINIILKMSVILYLTIFSSKIFSSSLTDYYYYQGKPFHLNWTSDKIFLVINDNISQLQIESFYTDFPELGNPQNIGVNDEPRFITLAENLNEEEFGELIYQLKQRTEVKCASPVFRMPEGKGKSDVQIGVLDQIIVQFKLTTPYDEINTYIQSMNLTIVQELELSGGMSYILQIPEFEYSMDIANELYLSGLTNYAEPNFYFTNLLEDVLTDPNDPFFTMQWSHRNMGNNIPGGVVGVSGCDMGTDSAWVYTMGSPSVVVSMVDTGIDTLHEDLSDRIIHGLSIDTYSNLPYAWDDNNHGTCTAGIVAATGNNNLGVIGVAPLSLIFGVKIFNSAGNTSSSAIVNGMIAAWQRGSWISSNSWGGGSPISAADNAINDGVNFGRNGKGVVWCFATGNENNASINWPSTLANVISVGGLSPCNQRKSTSSCDNEFWWGANYGSGLEIVAPAVKVYTTDRTGAVGYSTGNYESEFNGTSSATPNVAGVCALVLAVDSNLTWDVVRARICSTASKVGSYVYNQPGPLGIGNWNTEMGYGSINAYEVVKLTAQLIPVELTSFFAIPKNDEVTLNWTTATETNNQGFDVERINADGYFEQVGYVAGFGTTTEPKAYSYVDFKLEAGSYTYRLKQIDFDGSYDYSNELNVEVELPTEYALEQNYPNPFNPSTRIKYSIPEDGFVKLALYNMLGEEVTTIVNTTQKAGKYEVSFNASNFSSGVYVYRIETSNFTSSKKLMLMK